MSKTVFIFTNGILNNPEDIQGWTDRAVQWINKNTDHKSDKMEYRSGVLTRRLFQGQRANNLQKLCKSYMGYKIILVGHSNGCDIIQRLVSKGLPKIHEIHLIAAASEADFKKNGFNRALKFDHVNRIVLYVSANDSALKKAKWSTRLFGWMGFGYGYLGLIGPKNIDPRFSHRIKLFQENHEHSVWVNKKFEDTMKRVSGKP